MTFEVEDGPFPPRRPLERWVLCSVELIGEMAGKWSPPVQARIVVEREDGVIEMQFREWTPPPPESTHDA